jgi:two-component sensor histidine kinase/ligand-binding sensor protein
VPAKKALLDSESWAGVLELYARSVNVAVALVDHEGRLIGKCHNPQPIWSLARKARPAWGPGCIFCLNADGHCTAAADAEQSRSPVVVSGLGGFMHVAAPLFLGDRHWGTLLAGQVFNQYPELLLMGRVAREFGLSEQELWRLARKLIPVSRAALTLYGSLLGALGNAFLRERDSVLLQRTLAETNERLQSSNEDLNGKIAELAQAVAEKDILLNEVHHRVNNNLQVIASLLRMQAAASPDDRVVHALRNTQLRVESMALIHAHLYNSSDWNAVDFAEYTTVLIGTLFLSYGVDPARIVWRVEISPFEMSVDKAIPAGLILNELISNALKHAFPDGRAGAILVRGELLDGRVELVVQDDGVGTCGPEGAIMGKKEEPHPRASLGLKIVDILGRQLKGTLERLPTCMEPGSGSIFRLSFPYRTPARHAVSSNLSTG